MLCDRARVLDMPIEEVKTQAAGDLGIAADLHGDIDMTVETTTGLEYGALRFLAEGSGVSHVVLKTLGGDVINRKKLQKILLAVKKLPVVKPVHSLRSVHCSARYNHGLLLILNSVLSECTLPVRRVLGMRQNDLDWIVAQTDVSEDVPRLLSWLSPFGGDNTAETTAATERFMEAFTSQ